MQVVGTTIGNLFVKSGNFEPLVFKPSAAFLLAGKMLLCFSKFALVSSCISVILKSFSLGSDKQVLQAHIHTNRLISLFKWSYVFLFCKYRNEILSAWCFGNSYLADFAFYLTVYTALNTLLELRHEKPSICDRCKLWNGKTILRVLGFEVRKLRALLKEIGIGYFKAADSELQSLGIDISKPCCCFLLLQCCKRFSLRIVVIALTCEHTLFLALTEKVVVHKPSATEMPCQQIGLRLVRVQSELVCTILPWPPTRCAPAFWLPTTPAAPIWKARAFRGSNGISIWGLNLFSTGLTLQKAKDCGFNARSTEFTDWQKASFIESGNTKTTCRIVYDGDSREVLGAQLISDYDVSMGAAYVLPGHSGAYHH